MRAASATTDAVPPPYWQDNALVARCVKCWEHPGSKYDDGSGVCDGCHGAGWRVLAQREPQQEAA